MDLRVNISGCASYGAFSRILDFVIDKAYLLAAPISSLLELQSKSWVVELELELSAPRELTQSCGSDSAFRKGLLSSLSIDTTSADVGREKMTNNSFVFFCVVLFTIRAACHI